LKIENKIFRLCSGLEIKWFARIGGSFDKLDFSLM